MPNEAMITRAPRPARCRTHVEDLGSELELQSGGLSGGQRGVAAFIGLWLIGWSACCALVLQTWTADRTLSNLFLAVVFVASWFAVSGHFIGLLFGRQSLRIGPEGLEYRFSAIVPLRRRHVPLIEIKYAIGGLGLYIATVGEPIYFGQHLDEDEQRWLVEKVNQKLDRLRPRSLAVEDATANRKADGSVPPQNALGAEVLVRSGRPLDPPSDCRYHVMQDYDRLQFARPQCWNLKFIAGTTFLNAFWNGIVSVFIVQLARNFEWILFFFLVPFEVLGLLIFGVWFLSLAAPACREQWTFDRQQIAHRKSVLGLGWTTRGPAEPIDRIVLERRQDDRQLLLHEHGDYGLLFISCDERIEFKINNLTETEARWLADRVMQAYPDWCQPRVLG